MFIFYVQKLLKLMPDFSNEKMFKLQKIHDFFWRIERLIDSKGYHGNGFCFLFPFMFFECIYMCENNHQLS